VEKLGVLCVLVKKFYQRRKLAALGSATEIRAIRGEKKTRPQTETHPT